MRLQQIIVFMTNGFKRKSGLRGKSQKHNCMCASNLGNIKIVSLFYYLHACYVYIYIYIYIYIIYCRLY
jgi:hypothetical protein